MGRESRKNLLSPEGKKNADGHFTVEYQLMVLAHAVNRLQQVNQRGFFGRLWWLLRGR